MFEAIILPFLHCICCTTPEPVITPNMERTARVGKYFERCLDYSDGYIKEYFTDSENRKLINTSCFNIVENQQTSACTPLYFALVKNNYAIALWLLDNGAQPEINERKMFLLQTIKNNKPFDTLYIKKILEHDKEILDTEYIGDKGKTYTPLEYAQLQNHTKAVEMITVALKDTIEIKKK